MAILAIIGGIAFLASGIAAIAIAPLLTNIHITTNTTQGSRINSPTTITTTLPNTFVPLATWMGAGLVALGIAYFVMAYGLWRGKQWAWTITMILSIIGIVMGGISIVTGNFAAIFHLIINAIVLYYLYRPHVKMFFGKGATVTA